MVMTSKTAITAIQPLAPSSEAAPRLQVHRCSDHRAHDWVCSLRESAPVSAGSDQLSFAAPNESRQTQRGSIRFGSLPWQQPTKKAGSIRSIEVRGCIASAASERSS